MKTIALPQWPRMLSLSLGTLIIFYLLLANFFRPFLPLRSEDFPLPFLLFLCSLFFLLLLYSSGRILLPSLFRPGVSFFSHPLFLSLVDLWRNSPSRVYSSLESFLPPWAPWQRFLWSIIEKKAPGDLRTPFQRKIYALFFFLPSSLPPLSLGLEYYLRGEVNYFYYGLFLLWFPLIYRFLVFSLQDYCSRHKASWKNPSPFPSWRAGALSSPSAKATRRTLPWSIVGIYSIASTVKSIPWKGISSNSPLPPFPSLPPLFPLLDPGPPPPSFPFPTPFPPLGHGGNLSSAHFSPWILLREAFLPY